MWNEIVGIILLTQNAIVKFIISMFLAILIGLIIAIIYRYTHRGMNYESSFLSTIVIIAPIITLIMFFIQGDVVLSLGLVGSLSIIRFRTPIKDTRDMIFLFWAIATGLGCGTLNWTICIIASIILGVLILAFYLVKYGKQLHSEYILIIAGSGSFDENEMHFLKDNKNINVEKRSSDIEKDKWEIVYELRFFKENMQDISQFVTYLQSQESITKVSLLSPQLTLPM